jgi:hypothetical protein
VPPPSSLGKSRTVKLPLSGMVSVWNKALYSGIYVLTISDITYIDKAKRAEFEEKRKADPQWYGESSDWKTLSVSSERLTTPDITYIDKTKRAEFEEKRKADPQWYGE